MMDISAGFNPLFSDPDHDSTDNSPSTTAPDQNVSESPPKFSSSIPSPKKSRRSVQKRVVSIPIKEIEGSRLKGEISNTPPSDSWAWRKYGQKPIKGSPYPRGYYRCSSSKGCPARKQVERSRVDPTMLVVTYSAEHNHPWPASRNHHHHGQSAAATSKLVKEEAPEIQPDPEPEPEPEAEPEPEQEEQRFSGLVGEEFVGWFGDMETTSSTVLESPIFAESGGVADADVAALVFPMREEDESLFADLGELPECSLVFRHHRGGGVGPQVQIC